MSNDEIKDKEIQDFLKFMEIASKTCEEKGKQYDFTCPICGGKAQATKNTYNGHLWAQCKKCKKNVIQ